MRLERSGVRLARAGLVGLFAGLLAVATGCGGGTGDVSGKITSKGREVVYGTVTYVGPDGTPRSAKINPDGTYTVKDVGVGECKITVVSELPAQGDGQAKGGKGGRPGRGELPPDAPKDMPKREGGRGETPETVDPEIAKKWFAIPGDYGDVTKTKLRFTVRKGSNTNDIVLD